MGQISLKLPETLHQHFASRAGFEGISLDQYLLFLLAQHAPQGYTLVPAAESPEEQKDSFARLRQSLKAQNPATPSPEEIRRILDEREPVAPEDAMPADLQERLDTLLASRAQPGGRLSS